MLHGAIIYCHFDSTLPMLPDRCTLLLSSRPEHTVGNSLVSASDGLEVVKWHDLEDAAHYAKFAVAAYGPLAITLNKPMHS